MGFFSRRNEPDKPEDPPPPEDEVTVDTNPQQPNSKTATQETPTAKHVFDTALGAGSELEGSLTSDGNVRLDGSFKGELNITENVLVGVTAEIEANIHARNVSVAGTVRGDVSGEKIHLLATARVWGNINANALVTEDGAFIQGRVSMGSSDDTPPPPPDNITEAELAGPDDEDDDQNESFGGFPL